MRAQILGELVFTPSWLYDEIKKVHFVLNAFRAHFLIEPTNEFRLHEEKETTITRVRDMEETTERRMRAIVKYTERRKEDERRNWARQEWC